MEFQRKDDMANKGNYDWTEFYKHFADGLLYFKNNREDLVEKIIKDIVDQIFNATVANW